MFSGWTSKIQSNATWQQIRTVHYLHTKAALEVSGRLQYKMDEWQRTSWKISFS